MDKYDYNQYENEYDDDNNDDENLSIKNEYQIMEEKVLELRFKLTDYARTSYEPDLFFHFDFTETALLLFNQSYINYACNTEEKQNQL